jgi:ParB family chromosome partitioning protein
MTQEQIGEYAKARGFHPKILARLSGWEPGAAAALGRLAVTLRISENHLRDLMDWLEEIALRDNCPVDAILAEQALSNVATDPRLGRADKVKRIREMIRRRRFPRLAATEDLLQTRIGELKLAPEIVLSAPPGLEGGRLRVEFSVSSQQELQRLVAKLAAAAEKDAAREAFALLGGAAEPREATAG